MARILVIEDDEMMSAMIVRLLSEAGYEAESASNGKCGLMILETREFDLIVTDIVMPEKEGLETILEIRRMRGPIPIIAVSGGGRIGAGDYLPMAQAFGADYTFQKPFDMEPFLAAVRECLSRI